MHRAIVSQLVKVATTREDKTKFSQEWQPDRVHQEAAGRRLPVNRIASTDAFGDGSMFHSWLDVVIPMTCGRNS